MTLVSIYLFICGYCLELEGMKGERAVITVPCICMSMYME